jgi:hypothetical protein
MNATPDKVQQFFAYAYNVVLATFINKRIPARLVLRCASEMRVKP